MALWSFLHLVLMKALSLFAHFVRKSWKPAD